jgi:hypothetical protein
MNVQEILGRFFCPFLYILVEIYNTKSKIFVMINKIKEHFQIIALSLLLVIFLKQCGTSRNVNKIEKNVKSLNSEVLEIKSKTFTQEQLAIDLRITGLEAEKRMIQATDRKLLDVRRQSEIEKEIESLKKKK